MKRTELIYKECFCRGKQIEVLLKLVQTDECCTNSVFLQGNTATGKTHVIKSILSSLKLRHSYVNCIEYFTGKHIYQKILKDAGCDFKTCSSMMDFIRYLKNSSFLINQEDQDDNDDDTDDDDDGEERTFYIILDKADRLRNMETHLLPAFLRLSELTSLNICVILLSELIFEKFLTTTGFFQPLIVHFPDYSKSELVIIMSKDCPAGEEVDFYKQYCNTVVDVFFQLCRDLSELRHLAMLNFKKYCEPIEQENVNKYDVHRLWKSIGPHLRQALKTVYLREVSSLQYEAMQETNQLMDDKVPPAQVELPFYSKYMLLAAYFASYNPANTDRRFFAKRTAGRMSKRAKLSAKTAKDADKRFIGPKAFTIDRLMAIFYSICEGGASSSANILSQLSTLVTLNILVKTSADDQVDTPKYKCIVPIDFVVSVGKQVQLDVLQYLYDT